MSVVRRDEQFPISVSVVISLIIIVIIASVMVISTRQITAAMVPDSSLVDGWHERIGDRIVSSGFFNLNQAVTYTYATDDVLFPASLLVQTKKSLVLPSETQLLNQAVSEHLPDLQNNYSINTNTTMQGMRTLHTGHQTHYIVYQGVRNDSAQLDEIRCVIEVWNCGISKISVICIGVAQITNVSILSTDHSTMNYLEHILSDPIGTFGEQYQQPDGLIYSIRCH